MSLLLPPLVLAALAARLVRFLNFGRRDRLRLLWAGAPLLSLKTASAALASAGFQSITIANTLYPTVEPNDFDIQLQLPRRFPKGLNTLVYSVRATLLFARQMFASDVLHSFFNGGILGRTPLSTVEFRLWKLAGGRLVLMPYGGDAFIYAQLPDTEWANALKICYPRTAEEDRAVASAVARGCRLADAVVGCLVHDACLPRTDFTPLLWYPFDSQLQPAYPKPDGRIRIAHAANHPGVKGTESLIAAVDVLRAEGRNVELVVLKNVRHRTVIDAFREADVIVDQLLFGYALAALEGMALGKPVITGLGNDPIYNGYRDRGQLEGLPLIYANPRNVCSVLRELMDDPQMLNRLGRQSRAFAESTHGRGYTVRLFSDVYRTFK